MSILGNRVLRKEDPKFLTTGGTYLDDLDLPGALFLTYVRSTMAHAEIRSVDVEEVRRAPGVVAVFTAADVHLEPSPPRSGILNQAMRRDWLARDRVRFVGDPIVAVLTEERYQGPDAAELAFVDYEPLTAVVSVDAAKTDDTLLFPEVGTNACLTFPGRSGEEFFDGCDVVVRQRIVNQ
ncbi:MAG: xanthine dehydrogenase family protein molybdopterin-binding subunit, partial [Acidimicrobiia bacterium]